MAVELVRAEGGGASVRDPGARSRRKRVAIWISGACLVVATVAVCVSQVGALGMRLLAPLAAA